MGNMVGLTNKESEIILHIFKNFSKEYNANSLSKEIKITSRGALKILKKLEERGILIGKKMGKATFYRPNLEDNYSVKLIETLLISEARDKASRWLHEFRDIYKNTEIVIIFGSIIKNYKDASDIDILFVLDKKYYNNINSFVEQKNKVLLKPIHTIIQTINDLRTNLKKKNPVIISAMRSGYVLYGYDKLVGVIKNVRGI